MQNNIYLTIWVVTSISLLTVVSPSAGKTIYVDADATGANNGSSWANAYNYLQDALDDANFSAKPVEIRVAEGIYKPAKPSDPCDPRTATFQLINEVAIRGGYAGFGQPDPNARNMNAYKTILSGDLDGSMGELTKETFFDVMVPRYSSTTASYHVVLANHTDNSAILDGFTITGGVANGTEFDPIMDITTYDGGGIYCRIANPTIIDCTIRGNCVVFHAGGPAPMGGGIYNQQGNPTLLRCTLELNAADDYDGDSWAAGLMNYMGDIRLTDCVFSHNRTYNWGGGLANKGNATLERCVFVGNFAQNYGGAIYNEEGLMTLRNCLLEQNTSLWYPGGGITNYGCCEVYNCTFVRNTNYALFHWPIHEGDRAIVRNSIFWNDGNEITEPYEPIDVEVSYSDVRDGWPGEGNIDADPLFVDVGRSNYRLQRSSPCINAGDNSAVEQGEVDLDGQPRIANDRVDMGAYEFGGPRIIYVDDSADGDNDGSSWTDACNYLQDALMMALDGDEIRVAQGVYKPNEGIDDWDVTDVRALTFLLRSGVSVVGGHAGFGSPDPNRWDAERFETILSGDLAGNDGPGFANCQENSYHVVFGELRQPYPLADTVLDGFTITGGNADGQSGYDSRGGGILIEIDCALTVRDCTIIGNRAEYSGGGMHSIGSGGCASAIENCRFVGNIAGVKGGGISLDAESIPYLTNCLFAGNLAATGGALYDTESYPRIINCTFTGNRALAECGGVREHGGGVQLRSCILWGNSDNSGSGESAQFQPRDDDWPNTNYCCIQGWTGVLGGVGNTGANPCFANPGYWDPNGTPLDPNDDIWVDGDYHLLLSSPCIDAGDPNYIAEPNQTDLNGRPRVIGGRIDMGAYEFRASRTLYVDDDAAGLNNGSSWLDAYKYLQDALEVAKSGDDIRVAQGTYKPDEDSNHPAGTGDRQATFQLKNGVAIKGGYAGLGEADPNARDVRVYISVLSGDLSQTLPVLTKENFRAVLCERGVRDYRNSYHVVTGSGTDATAVLDGFVVTGGTANGPAFGEYAEPKYFHGGGVYVESGSPTLVDCVIKGNVAFVYGGPAAKGGGMYNMNSSPMLIRCSFVMNWADDMDSDAYGAGMMNQDSSLILLSCIFENNLTWNWGGGMYNMGASGVALTGCTFVENWAQYGGGAIWNELSADQVLTASGCLFAGNGAGQPGGAISVEGGTCVLGSCTFVGNRALHYEGGNAIAYNLWRAKSFDAANCIFRDGADEFSCYDCSDIHVTFSNVQGGWEGQGNIDADPCFADPGYWDANGTPDYSHDDLWVDGDYHLKSQAGRWEPNSESWVKDDVTSPCIDAGNPGCSVSDEPAPNGNRINMGAYGRTAEASKSPTYWRSIADITNDWIVNSNDLKVFADYWLETGQCLPSDFDRSQFVDFNDFAIFAGQWQEEGPGPGITYNIGGCIPVDFAVSAAGEFEPTRFTVTVEGRNIHFEDVMRANCCPEELEVQMTLEGDLITIYEIERFFTKPPCPCICDYPITATFGPFEPGIYTLEVYQNSSFIGSTAVTIENGQ